MGEVEGFDSLDDMFATMAAHEDLANMSLTPGQVRLRDDMGHTRYWARPLPEVDLVIYGRAETTGRVQAEAGFDATDNRERGYLTGTGYSEAVPDGEYGDTHVSQVVPISMTVFLLAKSLDWPTWSRLGSDPACRGLGVALAEAEQEARA
jgi:hypothetical protein